MTLSGAPAANQLAVANPWSMVPSLGNLDAYISAANRLPLLTQEEEQRFARRLRDHNDLEAAGARHHLGELHSFWHVAGDQALLRTVLDDGVHLYLLR